MYKIDGRASIDGKSGNTSLALSAFKESPEQYMKDNCPDDGFYLFIGAYDDDYHSFSILVTKEDTNFSFEFIDQLVGVRSSSDIDKKLLNDVDFFRATYPMKLELYQLRNKKK